MAVGRDRIIAEALDLLRRGESFASRKELAMKIGITPALLNYYFGRKCDLVHDHVVLLVEGHAKRFRQLVGRHEDGSRSTLAEALSMISRMYIEDGRLLKRYEDYVAVDLAYGAIAQMKRDLASILVTMSEEMRIQSAFVSTMTAMIWAVCATAGDEECVATCVALVNRMGGVQRRLDDEVARDPQFFVGDRSSALAHSFCVSDHALESEQRAECVTNEALGGFTPSSH